MEREELELINRLKNTKLVEEQAHQHLEHALNDPLEGNQQSAMKLNFHDSNSPLIEELRHLHDYINLILVFIITLVLVILIIIRISTFINSFFVEIQIVE